MKIILLDGNSIINRAFYGIRLFSNQEGLYTNGIYGFLNILLKLIDEEKPDGICVAFDEHAPTLRSQKYEQYKAQRKGMPDELAMQMPVLREILEAMNIRYLKLAGHEADDILGTLCAKLERQGDEGVVVTGDRDALQLISDRIRVKLVTTAMGQTQTTDYTPARFREEYGFPPEGIIDLKGLMGDPSDNIPGVPGIGKKTATDLVTQFGSVSAIYRDLDALEVKDAVKKKLQRGRDLAFLSYELATIDRSVPIELEISDLAIRPAHPEQLYRILLRLEFKSILERLSLSAVGKSPAAVEAEERSPDLRRVLPDEMERVLQELDHPVAVYIHPALNTVVFGDDRTVFLVRAEDFSPESFSSFLRVFFDERYPKVGHDIKTDLKLLLDHAIEGRGYQFDTALAAYLLNPTEGRYTVERLCLSFLGRELAPVDSLESGTSFSALSLDGQEEQTVSGYIQAVYKLHGVLAAKLRETDMESLYYDLELPLCEVLAEMEHTGMQVDSVRLEQFSERLSAEIDRRQAEIFQMAGSEFNIHSTAQLGEVLFERLGLPTVKKTKTGYSTSIEVLEKLKTRHPIIEAIIDYRQLTKLKSTYCDGLLKVIGDDGRIHTKFNMMVTATGRLSSTDPNLQNVPIRQDLGSEIRKMFVAGDGHVFVSADYSQIELRVLAHIAGDQAMIAAFQRGTDFHTATASEVFGVPIEAVTPELRRRAKAVNFGIVYGISDFSLGEDIGVSRAEAGLYIDAYLEHYSGVRAYMRDIVAEAKEKGYVKTLLHRQRFLPELNSKNFNIRSFGERAALNTPIQGSAADIIKLAMLGVFRRLKKEALRARLVLQVHDELIVEAPVEEAAAVARLLTEEMEGVIRLDLPLVAEASVGKTWYDAK